MDDITLPQAATSGNVTGALQQMLLSRMTSPQQDQQLQQNRRTQLGQYQEALRGDPTPGYGAIDHGFYSWLGNIGSMRPSVAAMRGVAEGGKFRGGQSSLVHQGEVGAAKAGYDDALFEEKQADAELRGLSMGLKSAGGKAPSPEQLRALQASALNVASQSAKSGQFTSPNERMDWIRQEADKIMRGYLQQFALQPTGPRGSETVAEPVPAVEGAQPEVVQPEVAPTQAAPTQVTPVLGTLPGVAPENQERAGIILQEWQMAKKGTENFSGDTTSEPYRNALRNMALARQELISQYKIDPLKMGAPIPTPTPAPQNAATVPPMQPQGQVTPPVASVKGVPQAQISPPLRNLPREKEMESTAKALGEQNVKEYEEISAASAAAKEQHDAFTNLEKIDPNTNAFAGAQTYLGTALLGLGLDPKSPNLQDAIKNRQAETVINQMRNAALRGEKGVQTRSDEVRIEKEFGKLTDPKQVWNYSIQVGKERTLRKMEMQEFADGLRAGNNDLPIGVRGKWIKEYKEDPLTQEFGGKLVFRSQIIDAFLRKYPDADKAEAVEYWRSLEQQYKNRQRSK